MLNETLNAITHGQQGGDCCRERGLRGLNGNEKNIIKIIYLKKGNVIINIQTEQLAYTQFLQRINSKERERGRVGKRKEKHIE